MRCQAAAELEHRGRYEAAREALGSLWQGVGQRPALEGLSELAAADVLLRVGALSGRFGSVGQAEGVLEAAKDLISESISRFLALGETVRAAAAQNELALCYRRAGAYDEARVIYHEALKTLGDAGEDDLRAEILLRLAVAEWCDGQHRNALRILTDAAELFERSGSHSLKGNFHNNLACVLMLLGKTERGGDYTDRAIIEYAAASHHFEQAGHTKNCALAENNLGFLLYTIKHYEEAHEHLNRARRLFDRERDRGNVARVDETRARLLLAEGRTREAGRVIRESVRTLEKGGEQPYLCEALTTQGRVLSRLGHAAESQNVLRRAADSAEEAGAIEDAGRALLTLIEEHAGRVGERELCETYQKANNLLRETQDAETVARLRECAARVVSARLAAAPARGGRERLDFWANFSLPDRVRAYEARYIRRALVDARGSVTHAARLLGLNHPTKLTSILTGRHKDLEHLRTPPEKRRRSIIRDCPAPPQPQSARRPARILHVEGDEAVAGVVKETLEGAGWDVVTCADGAEALRILSGDEPFDLLIFDYDLPGRDGAELILRARTLVHRRRVPSVMLAAGGAEHEAWVVGADAFLRKPEDVGGLAATVAQLLAQNIA